jgi:hypothetical protein
MSGRDVIGRLPYSLTKKKGMPWIVLPQITHFLGPAIDEGPGNINTRFIRRLEVTRELIEKLPKVSFLQIKCHRGVDDVIPFQEQRFKTSVQFTHEIKSSSKEDLWEGIYTKKRRVISRTLESMDVGVSDDPAAFMRFYQDNLDARKINNTLNNDICKKLIENSMARKRGQMYTVTNKDKKLTAAIFCAWDDNVSYHLLTTRSQEAGSGDISALIWKAMLDASNRGLIFDLGGLAGSGSAFFYSGFGANIRPRYVVTKASLPVQLAFMLLKSDAEYQYYI